MGIFIHENFMDGMAIIQNSTIVHVYTVEGKVRQKLFSDCGKQ